MSIKAATIKMLHKLKNVEKNTNKMRRNMKIMKKKLKWNFQRENIGSEKLNRVSLIEKEYTFIEKDD